MNTKKLSKIKKIKQLYSLSKSDPTSHVTDDDVKSLFNADELELFHKFMFGQGCPLVYGKPCYFPWDVSRFIRNYTK
jgi:hypothetical protein